MSLSIPPYLDPRVLSNPKVSMAMREVREHSGGIFPSLLWKFWLRQEVEIPWPHGWTPQDHLGNSALTADPNEWYREWLEKHVGRQNWTWDWDIGSTGDPYTLVLKFRNPKHATLFTLTWR